MTACSSKIKCYRITESNHTLVEWSCEYSSDVPSSLVLFQKKSFGENLIEIRSKILSGDIPILHHVHEAPSTRVIWLCRELGIPLEVREVNLQPSPKLSKSTELPISKGGLVTSFSDKTHILYESGAIVTYLLEKHDPFHLYYPQQGMLRVSLLSVTSGSPDRAKYLKYFFHVSSTIDHLLLSSYKKIFVENQPESDVVLENHDQWRSIAVELSKELATTQYIIGNRFTACDIMVHLVVVVVHSRSAWLGTLHG